MRPALLFLLTTTVCAAPNAEQLARIPVRMKQFVDAGRAAGFVTLIGHQGRIASLEAIGYQDRESRIPMRTDTIFQIMSLSKPITCAGAMVLVDEGRISLLDPVEKYLPEFKGQNPERPINIRDLMTHTSGLPGSVPKGQGGWDHTLAEVVSAGAKLKLQTQPSVMWSYSNIGIATVGRIIEVVSGENFEKFMTERILMPLNMKDTCYRLPAGKESRLSAVYTDDHGTLKLSTIDRFRRGAKYPSPEGGLYSTATDLYRFYNMMLHKGTLDGHRILSPAAVEVMTTVQTGDLKTGFTPGMGYGLGWSIVREPLGMFRYNSMGAYGHGGAYRTYGWVDPAKDLIGVLLYQRTNGGGDVAEETNVFMAMAAAAIER
ncbi:MAG: Beta-lactamase [Bryobacterales bacterium]|nr:Beta-lactamase [Bryobacterales bacterium]